MRERINPQLQITIVREFPFINEKIVKVMCLQERQDDIFNFDYVFE